MSISVSNISKLYGAQKALNNISFEVGGNEIIGFLGPNGAGKSTMMKILTCYIPPSEGSAKVCGFDILEQSLDVRKQIGYLPEHNPLYLDMYVKEFLEFVGNIHKIKNVTGRVKEMIDITGLQLEQNKKIGALSKGYRQRVGLAQAMIHDPKVLIMDEPTTGLDPNQLEEIRSLIKSLGKQKTVMLSTHIMQEVEAICDRVIIINKGEIVANDETKNLQKNTTRQIVTVEFDKEIKTDLLKTIEGVEQVKSLTETTWQLFSSAQVDIRKEIFNFAVANNLSVLTLNKEEQKIEDVFKELTK
ncbi:gliding motility-associated ABC transporter ATP-binding subunit GldA [Aurantibacillus circumpalustris]|uniref:gliding motility-associated ABC transporter ATP-binding subunit GldA n=1 Tax=Aurantibacillus circumpalustris TaxID=3036359 RepID=UPI00295AB3F6|nr:gliding motility-associated ABC transporter ATP-binding subunit GldA [Aurantibacillus circumpalustris]